MTDWTQQKAALQARRAELDGHLHKLEDALDAPMSRDWEDRSAERQGDEVAEALGTAELAELKRIDLALQRIAAGTYGTCVDCGGDIRPARLAAVPDTPLCSACAGGD